MFYCEAYRCRMDERHCVHYQDIVRGMDMAAFWVGDSAGRGVVAYRLNCVDCEQGRRVAASYKPNHLNSPPFAKGGTKGGFPDPARKEESMARSICMVQGCTKVVVAQGLCATHYDKWRRGDPEMVKLKGCEYKIIRPLKRNGGTPGTLRPVIHPDTKPVRAETKPVRAEVSKREPPSKGNGEIQVPDFEAKVLYVLARQTGTTITECFLRCLRQGIEKELAGL